MSWSPARPPPQGDWVWLKPSAPRPRQPAVGGWVTVGFGPGGARLGSCGEQVARREGWRPPPSAPGCLLSRGTSHICLPMTLPFLGCSLVIRSFVSFQRVRGTHRPCYSVSLFSRDGQSGWPRGARCWAPVSPWSGEVAWRLVRISGRRGHCSGYKQGLCEARGGKGSGSERVAGGRAGGSTASPSPVRR